jgi:hypothetical protein
VIPSVTEYQEPNVPQQTEGNKKRDGKGDVADAERVGARHHLGVSEACWNGYHAPLGSGGGVGAQPISAVIASKAKIRVIVDLL